MKLYTIPVTYESWGLVEVEADSFDEACEKCLHGPLPYTAEYVEGSLAIDYDSVYLQVEEDSID